MRLTRAGFLPRTLVGNVSGYRHSASDCGLGPIVIREFAALRWRSLSPSRRPQPTLVVRVQPVIWILRVKGCR